MPPKVHNTKGSKKRKKSYYVDFRKKQKFNTLEPGLQGFIITCNGNEKRCIRESYNILNEYAEKMSPSTQAPDGSTPADSEPKAATTEADVEEDFEKELAALKGDKGSQDKRFQQLYTSVKCCLFIQSKVDPCTLILKILEDIHKQGKQKTVSTQKMYPVLGTCKAQLDSLRKCLTQVLEQVLALPDLFETANKQQRYAVLFRARNNSNLDKSDVVTTVVDMVRSLGIVWEPEPRTPDCAISVDVLASMCCISVLPHYKKYKRYNLIEVAKREDEENFREGKGSTSEIEIVSNPMKEDCDEDGSKIDKREGEVSNETKDRVDESKEKSNGDVGEKVLSDSEKADNTV